MNENDDEDFETTSGASSCWWPQWCLWAGDERILLLDDHDGKIGNEMDELNGSAYWTAC